MSASDKISLFEKAARENRAEAPERQRQRAKFESRSVSVPSTPNQQRWHAEWELSRNAYVSRVQGFFCRTFGRRFACSVGA